MKLNAYSVYDRKALIYHPPFFQPADGAAARMLFDMANDSTTQIGRHPTDFVLYCVGVYDDQTAIFVPEAPARHIVDASAFVRIQQSLPLEQTTAVGNLKVVGGES